MQAKEQLFIEGPAGQIQAELIIPEAQQTKIFVMCHPHPLYQGTMDNKVVTTLTRAMNELGFISLRFNYRGVGQSAGTYGQGLGETDDALAVIHYLQQRFPEAKTLVISGFSFGGFVAYRAALQAKAQALILVAPAIPKMLAETALTLPEPSCPLLIIQGDQDEVIAKESVYAWLKTLKSAYTVKEISDATHFFHGKLAELRTASQTFIQEVLP